MDSAVATIIGAAIGAVAGIAGATVTAWRQTQVERQKSELSVWADFRNDILKSMWTAHRAVIAAMTDFILRTQQVNQEGGNIADLKKDIDLYRSQVHRSLDLLTPPAVELAQKFLEIAYVMVSWKKRSKRSPDDDDWSVYWNEPERPDDNTFKGIRREFTEHMTMYFHLGEVLPWMLRESRQNHSLESDLAAKRHKFGPWMDRVLRGLARSRNWMRASKNEGDTPRPCD